MIGYLKGNALELKTNSVILYTNGIGFSIKISLNTYSKIVEEEIIELNIHTYVREDRIELYGFYTRDELDLFTLLIKVNGVGPSMALNMLSGLQVDELVSAVREKDYKKLVKIPGIGKTKAEKVILDMQNKIEGFSSATKGESVSVVQDAIESLVALGFDEKNASKVVYELNESEMTDNLEVLIRRSLAVIKK